MSSLGTPNFLDSFFSTNCKADQVLGLPTASAGLLEGKRIKITRLWKRRIKPGERAHQREKKGGEEGRHCGRNAGGGENSAVESRRMRRVAFFNGRGPGCERKTMEVFQALGLFLHGGRFMWEDAVRQQISRKFWGGFLNPHFTSPQ